MSNIEWIAAHDCSVRNARGFVDAVSVFYDMVFSFGIIHVPMCRPVRSWLGLSSERLRMMFRDERLRSVRQAALSKFIIQCLESSESGSVLSRKGLM